MQSTSVPPVQQVQNPFAPPVAQVYAQDPFAPTDAGGKKKNPRMLGFGRALTAAILSVVGLILAMIAFELAMVIEEGTMADLEAWTELFFMSLPLVVIPAVFGILSVLLAVRARKKNGKMPIPTLILGIVGLGYGGMGVLFDTIAATWVLFLIA